MENYVFLENYAISEGAVSHNALCYQPLPIIVTKLGLMLIIKNE